MVFSTPVMIKLISAAFTLGFAYAAWNVGILHGNVTIMAVGSYFTPVLSQPLPPLPHPNPKLIHGDDGVRAHPLLLAL